MAETPTYTETDLRTRLARYETEYGMDSEEFISRWAADDLPFISAYFAWAGLCNRLGIRIRELA